MIDKSKWTNSIYFYHSINPVTNSIYNEKNT